MSSAASSSSRQGAALQPLPRREPYLAAFVAGPEPGAAAIRLAAEGDADHLAEAQLVQSVDHFRYTHTFAGVLPR